MKNKYYDEWELKQALEHIETNPLVAKCKLKSYIDKYPSDYMSFIYYAAVLITLGEFNEAEEILNDVEFRISVDEHYHIKISKENKYKHKVNILSSRMRLLAYQEKYDELYEFYEKNKQEIDNVLHPPPRNQQNPHRRRPFRYYHAWVPRRSSGGDCVRLPVAYLLKSPRRPLRRAARMRRRRNRLHH